MTTPLPTVMQILDIEVCIRFCRRTLRGFYGNMTLIECLKKQASSPRRMWLKLGPITWSEGGASKQMLLALVFHRRDLFTETVADAPHYYLSVGLGDVNARPDTNTGREHDPNFTTAGATEAVQTIKATCRYFEDSEMIDRGPMFIAPHQKLDLSQTRLAEVVQIASSSNYISSTVVNRTRTIYNGKTIWPDLATRKIQNY